MEMLVRLPEVHVVAFEPSPYNHFYLSRSMIRLAKVMPSVLQRFVLLPVAVGNSTASGETLFMKHNKGNQFIVTEDIQIIFHLNLLPFTVFICCAACCNFIMSVELSCFISRGQRS